MAATQADLARLDAILKDRPLLDGIQEAINTATPFAEKITQQLSLSGRKGIFPVQFGVNEGIYARADKGTFGDSQVDSPVLAQVQAKFIYALFEISGPTMSATRDDAGAFEDALALSLENTITGVKLDMARMILNKDSNGEIALVQSKTDTDTIVVDSPFGLTTYKSNVDVKNILRKNMPVDVIDVTAPPATKHHTNGAITAVTHSGTGTTLDLSTTEATAPADGDFVTRASNWGNEIDGFFAAVQTTGTYLNVARAGNVGWQGVVVDAANGGASAVALDPDMLRDTVDQIMEDSGEAPEMIVCNYKGRRNIYNLYAPQIRYAPMVLPAGLREETLAFDDMPVLAERFFPPQHIGFVNTRFWYHAIDKDVEWIQGLNGTVLHFTLTADTFKAVLRTYRNTACLYPAANGFLWGVSEA
jgi:hypothetical protein